MLDDNMLSAIGKFGVADYSHETSSMTIMPLDTGKLAVSIDGAFKQGIFAATGVIVGGSGNDLISSPRSGVSLFGGEGDDVLEATGNKSFLAGGPGSDILIADAQGTVLIGDAPALDYSPSGKINFYPDVFVVAGTYTSPPWDPVLIADFDSWGGDRIDLSAIDGNQGEAGHQELVFSQTGPQAHSVWYEAFGYGAASNKGFLKGDTNGNQEEDFVIEIRHTGTDLFGDAISSAYTLGLGPMTNNSANDQMPMSEGGIPYLPPHEEVSIKLPALAGTLTVYSSDIL
ncbi:hypothetical protein HEQ63_07105 [Haematospirillum jordaniae]|uniref:M10 family metallopeptidase C-terminal domain-containing protein n=1 Tax=Haematospirillum jordaniae TaxID=1549855 RepID=UPI001432FD41|nr:hypothetical protein [Haematospirillum jordaniae]NKD85949.1 hypothetical protein [Haematospirillum jordaniae]